MKKYFRVTLIAILGSIITSCSVNDPIVFDGQFVHIADESGSLSSVINWESSKYLATYYVTIVSAAVEADVEVEYKIEVGDGLTEGVDYKLIQTSHSGSVFFSSGIYRRPLRIEWLRNALDPTKDNTLTIRLVGSSQSEIEIGRPGPDSYGHIHNITKK